MATTKKEDKWWLLLTNPFKQKLFWIVAALGAKCRFPLTSAPSVLRCSVFHLTGGFSLLLRTFWKLVVSVWALALSPSIACFCPSVSPFSSSLFMHCWWNIFTINLHPIYVVSGFIFVPGCCSNQRQPVMNSGCFANFFMPSSHRPTGPSYVCVLLSLSNLKSWWILACRPHGVRERSWIAILLELIVVRQYRYGNIRELQLDQINTCGGSCVIYIIGHIYRTGARTVTHWEMAQSTPMWPCSRSILSGLLILHRPPYSTQYTSTASQTVCSWFKTLTLRHKALEAES